MVFSNTTPFISLSSVGLLHLLAKARMLGLIPSFLEAAHGMRAQGIYFHEGLVARLAARLGEVN